MSKAINLFIEKNDITGALKDALLGKDIEVPEGMTEDDFIKAEFEKHNAKRVDFFKAKYVDPSVRELVEKKAKELYPATINPIRKKAITLFDLDQEKFKDADPKDLLEAIWERNKLNIKKASSTSSEDIKGYQAEVEEYKKKVIDLQEAMTEQELLHKKKLEETAEAEKKIAQKYISDDIFGKEFDNISQELIVPGRGLLMTMKLKLKEAGYTYVVEEDSRGKMVAVPKALNGTSAMSLDGNRKVENLGELLLDIAAKENLKKANATDQAANLTSTRLKPIESKKGTKIDFASANFLAKKMGQKI